jgi:hypothetical protein
MSATATVSSQARRDRGIALSSRLGVHGALTPDLALAYLRELSPAVTAAAIFDGRGELRAGDRALAEHGDQRSLVVVESAHGRLLARLAPMALAGLAHLDATLAMAAVRDRC